MILVVANRGDSSNNNDANSTSANLPTAFSTRAATCALEVNVAMDVESNGGSTYQAIGVSSPIYSLSTQVLGTFESNAAQYGSSEAETKIIPVIRAACTKAGNPILTEGQVNDLIQLATGTDANSLKEVTIYATGTDGH